MNKYIVKICRMAAVAALATLAAACAGDDMATTVEPGTATPEGGNTPGVEITLNNPVITLTGIGADAETRAAATVTPSDIYLYVSLMDKSGKVTQSGKYNYVSSAWTASTPITVRGGAGTYYMRATANVTTSDGVYMQTCYSGTATVTADGTFKPDGALAPFDAQMTVTLKDADGNALTSVSSGTYSVCMRGAAQTGVGLADYEVVWTNDGTRPAYSTTGLYSYKWIDADGSPVIFDTLMPGKVPSKWNAEETQYTSGADLGSDDILLTVYKNVTEQDATRLPTTFGTSWDVTPLNSDGSPMKLTLEAGKRYDITITVNGSDAKITSFVTTGLDFEDADSGNTITIKN